MSEAAHCTDTLLVSVVGQAERARDTDENGERKRARGRFRTCTECMMGSGSRGWSA